MKLEEGEYLVVRVKKHWIAIIFPLIVGLFLLDWSSALFIRNDIIWLYILSIWFVYCLIIYFVEKITLTNRRLYVRAGIINIINRTVTAIPLRKINAVNYEQGFWGRILGYGTLLVQAGADLTFSGYSYIANPEKTKTMIEQAIEAAEVK